MMEKRDMVGDGDDADEQFPGKGREVPCDGGRLSWHVAAGGEVR